MRTQLALSQQRFLFFLSVTAVYVVLTMGWLDYLQAPAMWDEKHFWEASLTFSDSLLPSLDDLRNYGELNTPLPFMIFGALEYIFQKGLFAGRLLNLILSLSIVYMIGWPQQGKRGRALLCLAGLFLCPYYLWYGVLMYTDIIACFWVMLGIMGYIRGRHLLSGVAFILAISSRQYMVAFPAALATYEFIVAAIQAYRQRHIDWTSQRRWLVPFLATLSIFGWIYLFQGLAPAPAIETYAPKVQQTTWALEPGTVLNFLAFTGFYIVVPEFVLFKPLTRLKLWKRQWRRTLMLALGLLVCFWIFPPPLEGMGTVIKLANLLPHPFLQVALFYGLCLLACVRFSRLNLMTCLVLFNGLIMMKAISWDKYVLPLVVIFWYLKSIGLEEGFSMLKAWRPTLSSQRAGDMRTTEATASLG